MAIFCQDSFTDVAATDLNAHNADTPGTAWARNGANAAAIVISDANRARINTTAVVAAYYAPGTPSLTEQWVQADVVVLSLPSDEMLAGPCARMDTVADTFYACHADSNAPATSAPCWQLLKRVGGTQTVLGNYLSGPAVGGAYSLQLSCLASAKAVYLNGNLILSSSDNTIAGPGRAGMWMYANTAPDVGNGIGLHLDNFKAMDPQNAVGFSGANPNPVSLAAQRMGGQL